MTTRNYNIYLTILKIFFQYTALLEEYWDKSDSYTYVEK